MKLKNKKTGEIAILTLSSNGEELLLMKNNDLVIREVKLADLNEYEDYEEPKEYWYIDWTPEIGVYYTRDVASDSDERQKEIGNYFETKEEAEKAVEKLKAWKRLKGHNLRIERGQRISVNADNKLTSQKPLFVVDTYKEVEDDLDLLFGGEE